MTLYHFGNCVALIYVPYYLTYKFSGLMCGIGYLFTCRSEYGAFWKCIQTGCVYMCTQLVKMLILATFFPDTDTLGGTNIIGEFLKATVDLADLVGLYVVLAGIPGKGHSKVLTAGLGWATAEVILSRALLLWVGARGAEFDWRYIQKCLESNVCLIQHITTVTLIWLWSRHDLNRHIKSMVTILLVVCSYKPMLMELLIQLLGTGPWMALLFKSIVTIGLGVMTLQIYAGLALLIGIY